MIISPVQLKKDDDASASQSVSTANNSPDEPMLYCPACSQRLHALKCKLLCPQCGYYMSCADYI
jgi:hypothetical protein